MIPAPAPPKQPARHALQSRMAAAAGQSDRGQTIDDNFVEAAGSDAAPRSSNLMGVVGRYPRALADLKWLSVHDRMLGT